MGNLVDLTNMSFGRLKVIQKEKKRSSTGDVYWECRCSCGKTIIVNGRSLRAGKQTSCGCQRREFLQTNPPKKTHGKSKIRLYKVWRGMIDRCYYPSHNRFMNYGGRGIKVCDAWREDFKSFEEWAMKNGYDPLAKRGECTIDRINVDGDYEPLNCRFVNMKIQANNRQNKLKESVF